MREPIRLHRHGQFGPAGKRHYIGWGGADVDVMSASCMASDQLKLAGPADRLAAAGGR
jgi:hypothetical protein